MFQKVCYYKWWHDNNQNFIWTLDFKVQYCKSQMILKQKNLGWFHPIQSLDIMLKQFLRTLTKFNTTTAQFLFITKGHKKQNPKSSCLIHPLGKQIHFSLCLILDTYLVKENKFKGRQWQSLGRNKSNLWWWNEIQNCFSLYSCIFCKTSKRLHGR